MKIEVSAGHSKKDVKHHCERLVIRTTDVDEAAELAALWQLLGRSSLSSIVEKTVTVLAVDRESLRLGKYTSRYRELTSEQLQGLLWLLGEWSCRVHEDGTIGANKSRGVAAIEALREFHRKPLTVDEARALMRDAR